MTNGSIEIPLGRLNAARGWWLKPDPDGLPVDNEVDSARPALGTAARWLALEPITGRTHQLRVHCAAMGWPIVGDEIYGTPHAAAGRMLHLHAREIVVPISKNRAAVHVEAPVPEHMSERLAVRAGGTRTD